jgi:hypothetical protein
MTRVVTVQSQQRWEYHFEARRTETSLLNAINELGQQGWELVDAMCYKDPKAVITWGAFLKRPSIPQTGQPAQQAAAIPHQAASAPSNGKHDPLQRFDLSGDEFQLKTP